MDILRWSFGLFLGIQLLERTSFAEGSALPVPDDFISHGPQYRFQYFVRDERGDYKTQEEAGEGGNARGSYAVEEPDGDLRIVQYTADLGGGFKAHIKVDHAGKSSSKLQEIDIPAEEMRKLINDNRKKTAGQVPEVEKSSKSYDLGPPRKMSDIVLEQAAAIREIISKEIEAEEKREAEERLRGEVKTAREDEGVDVVDCEKENAKNESEGVENGGKTIEIATQHSNERTAKERNIDGEAPDEDPKSSQISNASRNTPAKNNGPLLNGEEQSPVVRVALSPKTSPDVADGEEETLRSKTTLRNSPREYSGREAYAGTPDPALVGPLLGGPVRNFSFKNRIMFYKPAEKEASSYIPQESTRSGSKNQMESEAEADSTVGSFDDYNASLKKPDLFFGEGQEEIYLWSPYEEGKSQGGRKGRYIKIPYEVVRPYFADAKTEAEEEIEKGEESSARRK